MTLFVKRSKISLPDLVRLYRGQDAEDGRPNKHLIELQEPPTSSIATTVAAWNEIVRDGVKPEWSSERPAHQQHRPSNHRSTIEHASRIRHHIRNGVLDGRYLIVDASVLEQWPEVYISPLGVVEKQSPDGTDVRLINDYSYPDCASVNEFTVRGLFPRISYNPPADIAGRIEELRRRFPDDIILLMLGDVSGAFRHIPVHADSVHMFAFIFDGFLVIDLACGFGWCGSPAYYSLAGAIINHLYSTARPLSLNPVDNSPFVGNVWCDDHTCVEVAVGSRCHDTDVALRTAMLTVLGPQAVNERKFTTWSQAGKALGLWWDTAHGTVSIPPDKIAKALRRLHHALSAPLLTKTELLQLVGSLRHVATCFPPARAFYQRLSAAACRWFGKRRITADARDDLVWFGAVLASADRFNSIPVDRRARRSTPSIHVYMDASDTGLCALEPVRNEFIRHRFDSTERAQFIDGSAYSINVRELHSAVLAVLLWGPVWLRQHGRAPLGVRLHIDNASAVAWVNHRSTRNPMAQCFLRLLSLAEFQYHLDVTAEHIAGATNTMADAGSRAWEDGSHRASVQRSLRAMGIMLRDRALADSTGSKYASHWKQWCQFAHWMGWSRWLLGSSRRISRRLSFYATYLWHRGWNKRQRGNHHSTIQLKLASIRWYHRRYHGATLTNSPSLTILLQGVKRLSEPVTKKQPITPAFLRQLRRTLSLRDARQRLLWGSVLLGFFFLLRRSEYLLLGRSRAFYCLKLQHTFFSDVNGNRVDESRATAVTIGLEGAKNDQYGRGAWRTMHRSGDRRLCPVVALKHILVAREALNPRGRSAEFTCYNLSAAEVATALKKAATTVGVPAGGYSTHSIRIGGATALLNGSADSLSIKLLGRWMSNCFEGYPVQAASSTTELSKKMIRPARQVPASAHRPRARASNSHHGGRSPRPHGQRANTLFAPPSLR